MGRPVILARQWAVVVVAALAVVLLHLVPSAGASPTHAHDLQSKPAGLQGQVPTHEQGGAQGQGVALPDEHHQHGPHQEAGACGLALPPTGGTGSAPPVPSAAVADAAVSRARGLDASTTPPPTGATRAPPDLHRMCVSRT